MIQTLSPGIFARQGKSVCSGRFSLPYSVISFIDGWRVIGNFQEWSIDFSQGSTYHVEKGAAYGRTPNRQQQTIPFSHRKQGGLYMSEFNVTTLAVEKLKEYMEQNNIESALRVALMQGG
jgi:hypothetical protein